MMHTLDIDHGAEVGLNHDVNHMLHGVYLYFEFRRYDIAVPQTFILPNHYDELVAFLFETSLTKTIEHAFWHDQICAGENYLCGYDFMLVDSKDGQTNITPEFIEAVAKWKRKLDDDEATRHN